MSKDLNILTTLWEKAKDHLSDDELEKVANLDEHASFLASNLSNVVEEIGCMVATKNNVENTAGGFKTSADVSTLLFSISKQIDYIGGLFHLATEANYRLNKDRLNKAERKAPSQRAGKA